MDFSNYKKFNQDYPDDKFVIYNKKICGFNINIFVGDYLLHDGRTELKSDPLDINLSLDSYKKFAVIIYHDFTHDLVPLNEELIIKIGLDKLNLKIKNISNVVRSSYIDVMADKLEAIENLLMEYSKE